MRVSPFFGSGPRARTSMHAPSLALPRWPAGGGREGGVDLPAAHRTPLQAQGFFQVAVGEQVGVGEDFGSRAVGGDFAVVQDDGTTADVEDEIEIVGSDDAGVVKGVEQADQAPAVVGLEAGGRLVHDHRMSGDRARTVAMATLRFSPAESR